MNTWNKIKLFASLAYEISPVYILVLFLRSFSSAGQIFGNVIFPKYLIDELMGAARLPTCCFSSASSSCPTVCSIC